MLFDGLSPIVCGVLGYISIILYDLNNTSHNNDRMQSLHTVGAGLIGLAFFNPVLPGLSEANSLPTAVRVIAGILALGFFALLTVYFTWRLKADEGDKWLFRKKMKVSALFWLACEVLWQFHGADSTFPVGPITGILFLYLMSQALVYGIYCVIQKKKTTAAM